MENTQPTLTEILHAARQHRRTLEMKRGDFQREARRSAERNIEHYTDIIFAADIRAARSAEYAANTAVEKETEEQALSAAPWPIGTKFYRWERVVNYQVRPNTYHWKRTDETAIFEVVTRTTRFADNLKDYSRPSVGAYILRLLKKSGETGLKFLAYSTVSWYAEGVSPVDADRAEREAKAKAKREAWMENPTLC